MKLLQFNLFKEYPGIFLKFIIVISSDDRSIKIYTLNTAFHCYKFNIFSPEKRVKITALNPSSFSSFFWGRNRLSARRERLPLLQYGSLIATIMEMVPDYIGERVRERMHLVSGNCSE